MSISPDSPHPGRTGQPDRPADHVGWAVYYRGPTITVTSRYVKTSRGRFAVSEIDGAIRELTYSRPVRTAAIIIGGIEIAVAIPFAVASGWALMLCVGFLPAAGLSIGALVESRRNPRWMELRVTYRGDLVHLFGTGDKVEFERVRRALIRAVEANRDRLP